MHLLYRRGVLITALGCMPLVAGGCTLALGNDFVFPDGDVPDASVGDALAMDATSDAGECMVAADCTDAPPGMLGACVVATCQYACDANHDDCDGEPNNGCEIDIAADRDNCGACSTSCGAPENTSPSCDARACRYACAAGFANCETSGPDCETTLGVAANCAACGDACPTGQFCDSSGGTPHCATSCDAPGTICGDACVDIATSTAHCGGCDMPCGGGEAMWSCISRACVVAACNMGFDDCDGVNLNGCETNLRTSLLHCGSCGSVCSPPRATGSCSSTGCGIATCAAGYDDCDGSVTNGCETDLGALTDCGGCGQVCAPANATPACNSATCAIAACDAGYEDCTGGVGDGCETSTRTLTDCGGCGVACALPHATESCSTGTCAVTACDAAFGDCTAAPGCETSLVDDELHCGACGNACDAGTECIAGVCDPVIDVAPGVAHSCALRRSGIVSCWGLNDGGQLGDGTTLEHGIPAPIVSALRFDRVTAGQTFTCAIQRGTGRLHCWGRGLVGELGRGTSVNSSTPVLVSARPPDAAAFGARQFVDVRAMASGACALDDMGEVWCWGYNRFGEVGDGTTAIQNAAVRVAGISGALELGVGANHACVRTATGVSCWGYNYFGQIGDGTNTNRTAPTPVSGLGAVTALSVGGNHACVIGSGGAVSCWGRNDAADLGVTGASRNVPVANGATADRLSCGNSGCFAHAAGGYVAWGLRSSGQHGDGTEGASRITPEAVPLSSTMVVTWSVAGAHVCGIDAGRLACWGSDGASQLGVRDLVLRSPTAVSDGVAPLNAISHVATGGFHTLVVRSGTLYVAGPNFSGMLGANAPLATAVPLSIAGLPVNVRQSAAGRGFACAIVGADGSRQLYCWGSSPGIASSGTPALIPIAGDEPIAIAAGYAHACVLVRTGAQSVPHCWGSNTAGELGLGTTGASVGSPTAVLGLTDAVELELGESFSCARRATGAVMCWGANGDGRVGDGTSTMRTVPTAVTGFTDAVDIGVGTAHACAVRSGGAVVCWGQGSSGRLGDGAVLNRLIPVTVVGVTGASAVAAGGTHTCAISGGIPRCWGGDADAQLGSGVRGTSSVSPVVVAGVTGAVSIAASVNGASSAEHTCVLLGDGTARCWGLGSQGRLGSGEDLTLSSPAPVLLDY